MDPKTAEGLHKAVKEVQIKLAEGIAKIKNENGWINMTNLGRYGTDYNTRAGVAYMGLGADMREDTVYPTAYVDGDGKPFDSANKYVMRFEKGQLPPTHGTWSVSQYKGNFYERNALDRYAIAPWMPLTFNADGSLDIYLQADVARQGQGVQLAADAGGAVQPHAPQLLPAGGSVQRRLQGPAGPEGAVRPALATHHLQEG